MVLARWDKGMEGIESYELSPPPSTGQTNGLEPRGLHLRRSQAVISSQKRCQRQFRDGRKVIQIDADGFFPASVYS